MTTLLSTFRSWKDQTFTPNFRSSEEPPPAPMIAFNAFLATMSKNGSGPTLYSEKEWIAVLKQEGVDDPDDIVAALESIASWSGLLGT